MNRRRFGDFISGRKDAIFVFVFFKVMYSADRLIIYVVYFYSVV